MPKLVDHAARRAEIAAAVQRLIDHEGLDGVTVAKAAATAGISVGQVQHYFASKDALLEATYRQVVERMGARVQAAVRESVTERLPIRAVVTRALREYLPLDAASASDHRVSLAFLGRTTANPDLAGLHTETLAATRGQLALAVHNGKECGEVPGDTDAKAAAARLFALTDGFALHLGAGLDPEETVETLREEVAAVFPGRCRQWK
ncbi:TetR/AcrR family transcriptional regulator [Phytomonospora endophytica]|uniref:AcrR family transcriptional regulator n=1 Tax=Phytomonospora endophytica TaxID=714109 RepID=A0A841FDV2_9ACTN|nr:TetR/AcrR family transcriptional regulator [Phytomonospora endophytica]MBB6035451.1 AcrR family transcriptional regulator [Phytomonospora endophytica]GIG63796.1 HTH-type transcriptional regulator BetI [Phytomonospora endophytica]